jgi:hypothetical protein
VPVDGNQAGEQGTAQGGHPECGKGVPDLPAPADEQADGERSNNTTESAQPHGPSNASGANGRGVQQGRRPDQARTRDTKKEAGEPQANNDECYGLTCVADCAERYGAANQSGRQNAASGEATHQKPGERRSEHAAQGKQSDRHRRSRALNSCSLEQSWCPGSAGRQHQKGYEIAGPQQTGSAGHASRKKLPHRHTSSLFAINDELTVGRNMNSRDDQDQQIPNHPAGAPTHHQELDRIG